MFVWRRRESHQAQAALRKKDCSHDDITQACRKWVALAQVSVSECTWDDASQTMQVALRGADKAQPTGDADYFELQISTGSWRRCSLADLAARAADVTAECCDEPTEDCSSGMPATCNAGCAAVLVPYWQDCATAIRQEDSSISQVLEAAMDLCTLLCRSGGAVVTSALRRRQCSAYRGVRGTGRRRRVVAAFALADAPGLSGDLARAGGGVCAGVGRRRWTFTPRSGGVANVTVLLVAARCGLVVVPMPASRTAVVWSRTRGAIRTPHTTTAGLLAR